MNPVPRSLKNQIINSSALVNCSFSSDKFPITAGQKGIVQSKNLNKEPVAEFNVGLDFYYGSGEQQKSIPVVQMAAEGEIDTKWQIKFDTQPPPPEDKEVAVITAVWATISKIEPQQLPQNKQAQ